MMYVKIMLLKTLMGCLFPKRLLFNTDKNEISPSCVRLDIGDISYHQKYVAALY